MVISVRESIKQLAKIVAETLPIMEPVYEFGSFQVLDQGSYGDLRPLFPGKQYVGCDMRPGPGVDRVLDLHDIELPADTAGTVLCFDTLEHVEYPHRALEEIHGITRSGGMVVIVSLMCFPIHEHPSDYWRYTPEGFKSLLRPFQSCWVASAGQDDFPHTVVGLGFKGEAAPSEEFLRQFAAWRKQWFFLNGRSWKEIRRFCTPPILRGFSKNVSNLVR